MTFLDLFRTTSSSRAVAALMLTLSSMGACHVKVAGKNVKEWFQDTALAALADAASKGDTKEIERLVQSGVPVDGLGANHITPLTFAMLTPNAKGMEALLKLGANPNHCIKEPGNAEGKSPIILFLTKTKQTKLLELLLQYGADPNTRRPVRTKTFPYRGKSLLIESVMSLDHVKVLVKYGADVNLVPQSGVGGGTSAIEVAAMLGQFDVVEFLLENHAHHLDEVAHELQGSSWSPDFLPRRLKLLEDIRARGGKIYAQYKPSHSGAIERYYNTDVPEAWLTPGYYQCKEFKGDVPVDLKDLR